MSRGLGLRAYRGLYRIKSGYKGRNPKSKTAWKLPSGARWIVTATNPENDQV